MELKCDTSLTLTKLCERTDEIWEYDAPQFFDFTRVGSGHEDVLNSSDYFRIDHESESAAFSTAISNPQVDKAVQPDIVACSLTHVSSDVSAAMVSESEATIDANTAMQLTKHVDCAGADDTLSIKTECHHYITKLPAASSSDCLSLEELSEAQDIINSPTPQKSRVGCQDDTPCSNGRQLGDRGRMRCVSNVITSAKKRLSMSVDRGRDKLSIMAAALAELSVNDRRLIPGSPSAHFKANVLKRLEHYEVEPSHRSEINLRQQENAESDSLLDAAMAVAKLIQGNEVLVELQRNTRTAVVPYVGIPFKPIDASKRITNVKPFSFEDRNKKMLEVKEERIRQVLEAEKKLREFRAQPFPDIIYSNIQPKSTKPLTVPIGPRLPSDSKPKKVVGDKQASLAFKAKPAAVVHKAPFIPAKSSKPTTGHVNFNLSTEHRAARRADWDKWKEEKDRKEREQREERERQQLKDNEAETKRLRQLTVHKAQPLPRYLQVKSSKVPADKGNNPGSVILESRP